MVETPSTMLPLGSPAPPFSLPDTDGRIVTLDDWSSARALLVMFICNHCPYVKHVRAELARLGEDYGDRDVGIVAISSNDVLAYPQDGPLQMKVEKQQAGYTFPYVYDETQEVARAYRAACTPDFYVFGEDRRLAYRGQLDGSRPGNGIAVTGSDVRAALEALLAGQPVSNDQRPSIGCNIKWKPGPSP